MSGGSVRRYGVIVTQEELFKDALLGEALADVPITKGFLSGSGFARGGEHAADFADKGSRFLFDKGNFVTTFDRDSTLV